MTIEETLKINFDEFLSCFDDEGEIKDGFAENAQCCIDAINKAVDKFVSDAEIIAHDGFNLSGNNFHAKVDVSVGENAVSLNITRGDCSGVLASFNFELTLNLVLTKSYYTVSINLE